MKKNDTDRALQRKALALLLQHRASDSPAPRCGKEVITEQIKEAKFAQIPNSVQGHPAIHFIPPLARPSLSTIGDISKFFFQTKVSIAWDHGPVPPRNDPRRDAGRFLAPYFFPVKSMSLSLLLEQDRR
jgi:hypothetical protein